MDYLRFFPRPRASTPPALVRAVVLLAAVLAVLLGAACGQAKDPRNGEIAIRSAIFHYLGQRANLTPENLIITIKKLDTQGDTAVADVTIAARGNQDASMDAVYHLKRVEGKWEVDPESTPGIGSGHGGMGDGGGQMPSGHPPISPGGQSGGTSGGPGSKLPEGHPPVPTK